MKNREVFWYVYSADVLKPGLQVSISIRTKQKEKQKNEVEPAT